MVDIISVVEHIAKLVKLCKFIPNWCHMCKCTWSLVVSFFRVFWILPQSVRAVLLAGLEHSQAPREKDGLEVKSWFSQSI